MKTVKMRNKIIGPENPCFISFEPGATYANLEQAKMMTHATSLAKADGIKFQTLATGDADRLMGIKDIKINFGTANGKKEELVYDALKRRELPKESWRELVKYSHDLNLVFITTPEFPESIEFLVDAGVDALKISKGDINNVLLIEEAAKTNIPIILDGREKFHDVEVAMKICEKNGNDQIIIMHCPSGYPTENAGVHLRAINAIQEKCQYPVGFADHSPGDIMNFAAVAMGASMLEKTITTDKAIEHVEHFMSLELSELKRFVENIRAVEQAMGNPDILSTSRVEETARRSLVAIRDIKKGEKITKQDLDYKRPGNAGISVADGFKILDKRSMQDITAGTFLQWNMLD
ncbi:N-acetylneuraminate synthase [Nitrosotalea devaniterrae]|uniref:N-acetylneuraminate synthase n=1 Tax=Nitrosotalea devaniterrae TaxID=1078905 RepID=A0A128A0U7_9ARCH|nr:N-acetylneuraminate synthase [Candidatus Nitrosotalea devanaterra]